MARRELLVQFSSGIRVRDRHLDRFHIQFFRKVQRALDGLLRFSGEADDEVAVDLDSDLLAILGELPRHLDGRALLDVPQNLWIARFIADDKEPRSRIRHSLQGLIVTGYAGRA